MNSPDGRCGLQYNSGRPFVHRFAVGPIQRAIRLTPFAGDAVSTLTSRSIRFAHGRRRGTRRIRWYIGTTDSILTTDIFRGNLLEEPSSTTVPVGWFTGLAPCLQGYLMKDNTSSMNEPARQSVPLSIVIIPFTVSVSCACWKAFSMSSSGVSKSMMP
jgi:hypothetical protein